jgi:transcription elongation factor GreB
MTARGTRPPAAKAYITPEGHGRLQEELDHLWRVERPRVTREVSDAAALGDRSENAEYIYGKRRLREIDRRVRFLLKRIEIAMPVDARQQKNRAQVFFGATVTYANGSGAEQTVRIVGIDEARSEAGEVSWVSPVARALLKAREGDIVQVHTPGGLEPIEVVKIASAAE